MMAWFLQRWVLFSKGSSKLSTTQRWLDSPGKAILSPALWPTPNTPSSVDDHESCTREIATSANAAGGYAEEDGHVVIPTSMTLGPCCLVSELMEGCQSIPHQSFPLNG